MPTKTFTHFDATGVTFTPSPDGFTQTNTDANPPVITPLSVSLIETGIGSYTLNINLNSSCNAASATAANSVIGADLAFGSVALVQEWTVDYDGITNKIPDDARITKLVFRRPRSVNYTFNATDLAGGNAMYFIFYSDALATPIYFTPVDILPVSPFIGPALANETIQGAGADEILFDIAPAFISKADLIANWNAFNNNLYGISIFANSDSDGISPVTAQVSGSLTFGLGWEVIVTYEQVYKWTISQDPSLSVTLDTPVTFLSPLEETDEEIPVDFTKVTAVDILVPDPLNPGLFVTFNVPMINWTLISAHKFIFLMIDWGPYTPTVIRVRLTSTQFSGTVERKVYTIYFVSGSGIYELVPDKTNDTLYIEAEPGETIDVKIPNPSFKTGYF